MNVSTQLALLKDSVQTLWESEPYQKYLRVMARFPSYSVRNTILIYAQNPNATFVAGYQTWQRLFSRHVKKGEHGIRILAPYTYKRETKEEDGQVKIEQQIAFRTINVFDISQTEGKPLPQMPTPTLLLGDCPLLQRKKDCLEKLTHFQIVFSPLPKGHYGVCQYENHTICINQDLEERHAFKTLIHECAHALLHHFSAKSLSSYETFLINRQDLREIEAESVSYVVCQTLGIECSQYSFSYIAHWKQEADFFEQSLERIAATAQKLINGLLAQDQEEWLFPTTNRCQSMLIV